jgi:anti-anti-sigma factor
MSTSFAQNTFAQNFPQLAPESDYTCGAADFTTFWLPPATAIVAAVGELDAVNATEFAQYAWRAGMVKALVLDLTGIEFCGTAAYSALLAFNARCAAEGIDWVMVPSHTVDRLLHICDPDSVLPVQPTVEAALAALPGGGPLLQLVAEPR